MFIPYSPAHRSWSMVVDELYRVACRDVLYTFACCYCQKQDYVGLDTCLSILNGWVDKYPTEPSFVVPECLKQKVAAGKLGRKTGEGFYIWNGDKRAHVAP